MDPDYTALASRIAARAEVIGCLVLSRDGLVLGAFPPGGEHDITPAWLRFAEVGDPRRGFVQFEDQTWAYASNREYAAFAVAGPSTRPGILIEYLEQVLVAAGQTRSNLVAVSAPQTVDLISGGFREGPPLPSRHAAPTMAAIGHDGDFQDEFPAWDQELAEVRAGDAPAPEGEAEEPAEPNQGAEDTAEDAADDEAASLPALEQTDLPGDTDQSEQWDRQDEPDVTDQPDEHGEPAQPRDDSDQPDGPDRQDEPDEQDERHGTEDGDAPQEPMDRPVGHEEVDRVALAREFAQLQDRPDGGEGAS